MQTEYTEEKAIGFAGQLIRGHAGLAHIDTGVNAQVGRPKIGLLVFAGTWAAADTSTATIGGVPVVSTLQAGEDTPGEARDRTLATLQANANITRDYILESVGADSIRVTGRERGEGTGQYVDFSFAATETTAGNGTMVASVTQTAQNRGDLPFGVGVVKDTTDTAGKRCLLPSAAGQRFAGVVIFSHAHDNRRLAGSNGVPAQDSFNRCLKGRVLVQVEEAVAAGDPAFLRHTANANGNPGGWRNDADAATADAVPAFFETAAAQNGLAVLIVNAP